MCMNVRIRYMVYIYLYVSRYTTATFTPYVAQMKIHNNLYYTMCMLRYYTYMHTHGFVRCYVGVVGEQSSHVQYRRLMYFLRTKFM